MRKTVRELIEPTIIRSHEDRERTNQFKALTESIDNRLSHIETIVIKKGEGLTVFEEIKQQLYNIDQSMIKEKHTLEGIKLVIDTREETQKGIQEIINGNIRRNSAQIDKLHEQNFEVALRLQRERKSILETVEENSKSTKERITLLEQQCKELQNQNKLNQPMMDVQNSRVRQIGALQDQCQGQIAKMFQRVQSLEQNKQEKSDHNIDLHALQIEIDQTKNLAETFRIHFQRVENYIEKYQPAKIQSQISKSLQSSFGKRHVKFQRYLDFEHKFMDFVNEVILKDEGQPQILEIQQDMYTRIQEQQLRKSQTRGQSKNKGRLTKEQKGYDSQSSFCNQKLRKMQTNQKQEERIEKLKSKIQVKQLEEHLQERDNTNKEEDIAKAQNKQEEPHQNTQLDIEVSEYNRPYMPQIDVQQEGSCKVQLLQSPINQMSVKNKKEGDHTQRTSVKSSRLSGIGGSFRRQSGAELEEYLNKEEVEQLIDEKVQSLLETTQTKLKAQNNDLHLYFTTQQQTDKEMLMAQFKDLEGCVQVLHTELSKLAVQRNEKQGQALTQIEDQLKALTKHNFALYQLAAYTQASCGIQSQIGDVSHSKIGKLSKQLEQMALEKEQQQQQFPLIQSQLKHSQLQIHHSRAKSSQKHNISCQNDMYQEQQQLTNKETTPHSHPVIQVKELQQVQEQYQAICKGLLKQSPDYKTISKLIQIPIQRSIHQPFSSRHSSRPQKFQFGILSQQNSPRSRLELQDESHSCLMNHSLILAKRPNHQKLSNKNQQYMSNQLSGGLSKIKKLTDSDVDCGTLLGQKIDFSKHRSPQLPEGQSGLTTGQQTTSNIKNPRL